MSEKAKHVLLREDLKPVFDEAEGLAAMAEMAEEAGDWRGHVPYAAARSYHDDPAVCAHYEAHVDECAYCRRMIDALNPSQKLLEGFRELVQQVQGRGAVAEEVPSRVFDYVSANVAAGSSYCEFLSNPSYLQALEAEDDVMSKFKAARIYLETPRQWLAYQRIGEGCALANVDGDVIGYVTAAGQVWGDATKSLADSAYEVAGLMAQSGLDNESEQLRLFGVLAQLGRHDMAMESLHTVLMRREGTDEVVEALEAAELVTGQPVGEQWKAWLAQGMVNKKRAAAG